MVDDGKHEADHLKEQTMFPGLGLGCGGGGGVGGGVGGGSGGGVSSRGHIVIHHKHQVGR